MRIKKSERGFNFLVHARYAQPHDDVRLASQSSAIGNYADSYDRPGTSFLWIGELHHLNREEVAEYVAHLSSWLATGSLEIANASA